jgi:patatin-like phospholipase/acyl hydrolase
MWKRSPASPPIRVLAIDGGGVRGIIPMRVLSALQRLTERPIVDLFDVMVGTSTGGMIVLGLSKPGADGTPVNRISDIEAIYRDRGDTIFPSREVSMPRSLKELRAMLDQAGSRAAVFGSNPEIGNARYSPEGIESEFESGFGETPISAALTDVVVTTMDMQTRRPLLFSSRRARENSDCDILMRHALRATTAAPTYFPPLRMDWNGVEDRILLDGGVFAKNPSLVAYMEGVATARSRGLDSEDVVVVSLGTGVQSRETVDYEEFIGRNWIKLAEDVFNAAEEGESHLLDMALRQVVGEQYWRFQTVVPSGTSFEMDNVDPAHVEALASLGDALVGSRLEALHAVAAILAGD